jgi:phage tail sheath protein FI
VNAVNPIMAIPGEGNAIVWGQKTATATPSAMDRVNVRRLLIHLEKSISTAVTIGLFEFNDAFTRTRLFNIIDPFLRSVKNRRGLYDYRIVVDESNNTPFVIDQNGLVIDIYLQPIKVAEFIRVNAIVVPTGATFSEYVGSF